MKPGSFLGSLICLTLAVCSLGAAPLPVIFDTDMNGDCDDAGALAVLHALADQGEAEIIATVINAGDATGASGAATDVINTYYGRPDIPLAAWRAPSGYVRQRSPFARILAEEFPHDAKPDNELPDATALLRRTLAVAADQSVVYCSVGSLSNMAALLASPPDEFSPLSGRELVARKVLRAAVMGGGMPDSTGRPEANMRFDAAAAVIVPQQWPTPIVWVQSDIGWSIITGSELQQVPHNNPVRRAYEKRPYRDRMALDLGKPSHDQAAVLLAVRGPEPELWDIVNQGRFEILPDLGFAWHADPQGLHRRVGFKGTPLALTQIIGQLMVLAPMHGVRP